MTVHSNLRKKMNISCWYKFERTNIFLENTSEEKKVRALKETEKTDRKLEKNNYSSSVGTWQFENKI